MDPFRAVEKAAESQMVRDVQRDLRIVGIITKAIWHYHWLIENSDSFNRRSQIQRVIERLARARLTCNPYLKEAA